ncbi:uncharacterized protein LOC106469077 [Limulus polyphemus]|uniref:Uncharacterized protein LOC106469077 n=1 Tax=Limulus polyphemus TaxID=6850 RepID=A0ABM1TBD4_LIMPO|nr:uncharacterized protein LOC106469077 [Limulus polyphemus]XP_022253189.1 uncharacterized protein LOC106469077 [Limulus polyphemus]XP_022253190.1 uncharacterized protein LOC106469077 [Limulus polyphemus]
MATHAEQFSVHCTWEVEGNRSITEAVSWAFGTDSPDLEEEITPDNCVLLQPPTSDDHIVPGCQLFVSCPPTHVIHAVCILCEAKMAEVYGRHGEYLETVRSRLIDEVDGMVVFRIDVSFRSPPSECCLKLTSLKSKSSMWLYGLQVQTKLADMKSSMVLPAVEQRLKSMELPLSDRAEALKDFVQKFQQPNMPVGNPAGSSSVFSSNIHSSTPAGTMNFTHGFPRGTNDLNLLLSALQNNPASVPTSLNNVEMLYSLLQGQSVVTKGTHPPYSLPSGLSVAAGGAGLNSFLSGQQYASARPNLTGSLSTGQPFGVGGAGLTSSFLQEQQLATGGSALPSTMSSGQLQAAGGVGLSNFLFSGQPLSNGVTSSIPEQIFAAASLPSGQPLAAGGVTLTSSISPKNPSVSGGTGFLSPFTPRQPFVAGGTGLTGPLMLGQSVVTGSLTPGQPVNIGGTGLTGPLTPEQPMATVGSLTSGQPVGIGGTGLIGPLTSGQPVSNGRMGLSSSLTPGHPTVTGTGSLSSQPISSEGATSLPQQPLVNSALQHDGTNVLEHLLTALQQLKTGIGSCSTTTSAETQKETPSPTTRDQISNKDFHEVIQQMEQKLVELIGKQLEERFQRMTAEFQASLHEHFQTCQQQLILQIKELLEGQLKALENQLTIKFRQRMDDLEQKVCCKLDELTEQLKDDSE